jgi:RNA polymerase primary sigma factor
VPADKPAPDADAASTRSRTVAASTRPSRTSASVEVAGGGAAKPAARKRTPAKPAAAGPAPAKPGISPSHGAGEGTVLTAVATDDTAVAVIDAGAEGLTLDEAVVAGPDGAEAAEVPAVVEEATAEGGTDFEWDDEEESEALRQARKDAELTASADSVRAYLKQIGKVALLNAEEEVELAKRIEAGLYAPSGCARSRRRARSSPRSCAATSTGSSATASAPRTTCWRPTSASWSPSPSATPAAAWRSWT